MRIENWCIVSRGSPALKAPEQERLCLHGIVQGHPRCPDGKEITTSLVLSRNGERVVTKSGSEYELGEVDTFYESLFPQARQRLFAQLTHSASMGAIYEI